MHNSQGIVNLQGLFVLSVGYVDVRTYPLIKYSMLLKEHILFIRFLYLLYLSVHFHSYYFYMQYHGTITEITFMTV